VAALVFGLALWQFWVPVYGWLRMKKYEADLTLKYAAANKSLHSSPEVVFYGDSITEFWANNYPATFFPEKQYIGRGIAGQTTAHLKLRFKQDVIDLKPNVVVILGGTNDIGGMRGPIAAEETESNIQTMSELAKLHGIRVVLCSILPTVDPVKVSKIVALNGWTRDYASRQNLTYVDYYSAMVNADGGMKDGISVDGVHPNELGYKIMERLAQTAIEHRE
jgi:lysophospholipase L1-like esterase